MGTRLFWRGIFLLTLVGCIKPNTQECQTSTGTVMCPAGFVCLASGGGCTTVEQANACVAKAEGERCVTADIVAGRCSSGACVVAVCGNGLRDPGEACDDGNIASSDGCSSNCSSTEVCGNGVRDPGEACDDGNQVDGDGCQNNCKIPKCGDGIVDSSFGEACDNGAANSDSTANACRTNCQPAHAAIESEIRTRYATTAISLLAMVAAQTANPTKPAATPQSMLARAKNATRDCRVYQVMDAHLPVERKARAGLSKLRRWQRVQTT
jgi:cysteine-rich repeat protein